MYFKLTNFPSLEHTYMTSQNNINPTTDTVPYPVYYNRHIQTISQYLFDTNRIVGSDFTSLLLFYTPTTLRYIHRTLNNLCIIISSYTMFTYNGSCPIFRQNTHVPSRLHSTPAIHSDTHYSPAPDYLCHYTTSIMEQNSQE